MLQVRLLMMEECDLIIECRVCRGLFRALPNFIAHKRVYCCQAYCNFNQNQQFEAATSFQLPPEQLVEVEPVAPEEPTPADRSRDAQPGACQDGSREEGRDVSAGGSQPASHSDRPRGKSLPGPGKAQAEPDQADDGRAGGRWQAEVAVDEPRTLTGPLRSDTASSPQESGDKGEASCLVETVRGIEAGRLGRSKEYAVYTAAAEKMERETAARQNAAPLRLTAIPAVPCAVFVNSGSAAASQALAPSQSTSLAQAAPSVQNPLPVAGQAAEEDQAKNPPESRPRRGASPKPPSEVSVTLSRVGATAAGSSGSQATSPKAGVVAKGTLRNVARVVRELRLKKGESILKERAKQAARKSPRWGSRAPARPSPGLPSTRPPPRLPATTAQAANQENRSGKEMEGKRLDVAAFGPKGDNPPVAGKPDKGGSLRAVVKRCLTGRPGALRLSPHKTGSGDRISDVDSVGWSGERSSDGDCISEAGSFSDRGESASTSGLLRQQEEESLDQSAIDLDNMCCRICKVSLCLHPSYGLYTF